VSIYTVSHDTKKRKNKNMRAREDRYEQKENPLTAIRQARTRRMSVEHHDVIARKIGALPRGFTIGRAQQSQGAQPYQRR
jgi:hypothetical protein